MNWIDDLVPEYGTVTGQYVAISYDSSDADLTPDVQPLNGTITLTPTVTAGRIDTALAQILAVTVRVFGGQIVDDEDQPGVRILSTDTDLGVQDWAWTARFVFESGLKLKPLPFKVATGETVSLTSGIVPVESAPYQIIQGEPGASITAVDQVAPDAMRVVIEDPATGEQKSSTILLPEGPRGLEGPYGGTAVTDPQVASYVTTDTKTRDALDDRYRRSVSATEHGATGDGVADDTAAIQAAIDAATPFGLAVSVPAGRYRITSSIDMPSEGDLRLSPSAVLDISEMPGSIPAISAAGTIGSPVSLSADAAPGDRAITVSDAAGLSAGGWVKITSALPFGYTNQPAGEIHQVVSISGDTVTLVEALSDVYTVADSAAVAPVEFRQNIRISGGAVEGNPDTPATTYRGVVLDTCRNVTVTGMSFRWVHYVSVWLRDTIGATVLNCRFDDALSVGLGYGVMMSEATQNVSVTACHGTRARHFVTFGGGAARAGIVRRVTVTGCNFSQCIDAGLDAHPGAEDFAFVGNTITGSLSDGIVVQGGRFVISGNVLTGSARHGVIAQAATRRGMEGVISGNTIHGSGNDGIRLTFRAEPEYQVWSGMTISGNTVTDSSLQGIHLFNSDASIAPEGVAITGNVLRRNSFHAIYLRGGKDMTVGSNIISDVPATMEGIFLQDCPDSTIHGNVVRGGLRAYRLSGSPNCTVTGNRGTGAGTGLMSQATAAPVIAMGNNFAGCATPMSIGGGGNITTTSDAAGAYNL